ncbi:MAG: hypothetical protein HYV07_25960 [Deltaproteobacteria bacterium]|nr:hypothetical protein [Deltaproteobacteria bacterium]
MARRVNPDAPVRALIRALEARIEAFGPFAKSDKDGIDVYLRDADVFMQMEVKQEYLSVDLWLPYEDLDEARSSGIARTHPFLGEDAIRIRFERAQDLARVARWAECSYERAPDRAAGLFTPPPAAELAPVVPPPSTPAPAAHPVAKVAEAPAPVAPPTPAPPAPRESSKAAKPKAAKKPTAKRGVKPKAPAKVKASARPKSPPKAKTAPKSAASRSARAKKR